MSDRPPFDHNGPPAYDSAADLPPDVPRMHYFKCDINALWDVMIEMPFELGGFYMRAILSMYKHMEGLPADDNVARMRLGGIDIRTYRRMKAALLRHPKCFIEKPSGRISNARFEQEIIDYVTEFRNRQRAGLETAEKQRVARATRRTSGQLPAEVQPKSGGSPTEVRETSGRLPANIKADLSEKPNKINEATTAVPPQRTEQENSEAVLRARVLLDRVIDRDRKEEKNPVPLTRSDSEPASANVCVMTNAGHGVMVNGETIKHAAFAISLPAIQMGAMRTGLSKDEIRTRCLAHAIQWAAEIENGRKPRDVVPGKLANFLVSSIIAEFNRELVQSERMRKAADGTANGRPSSAGAVDKFPATKPSTVDSIKEFFKNMDDGGKRS